jgi:Flp pilus assembly protein protease CpaA
MGIGFSIFLLAVGAILAFAVHATVAGVDIHVVGWILMGAGALGLILTMIVFAPRRRRVVGTTAVAVDREAPSESL